MWKYMFCGFYNLSVGAHIWTRLSLYGDVIVYIVPAVFCKHTLNDFCISFALSLYQNVTFVIKISEKWNLRMPTCIQIVSDFIRGGSNEYVIAGISYRKKKNKRKKENERQRDHNSPLSWHWKSRITYIHIAIIHGNIKIFLWPSNFIGCISAYSFSSSPFESFKLNVYHCFFHYVLLFLIKQYHDYHFILDSIIRKPQLGL